MCGIAGYRGPKVDGQLETMLERMRHRGPDDDGFYEEGDLHLGMRRLSIVDLASGKQPKFDTSGDVVVLFNGEIYNYVELQEELQANGTHLASKSDTEVIAHLYAVHGIAFIDKLVGMFAISLVDRRTGDLFLIRDRLGKKPIYYAHDAQSFAYASEINALPLRRDPEHLDRESLLWYFSQKTTPGTRSIDLRIHKVPAGHYLRLPRSGPSELVRYWNLGQNVRPAAPSAEGELIDQIDALITSSVRLRMRADVEVGAFLSGGVDSSLTVALASRCTDKPLKTYCLVYDQEINHKSSDRKFARLIAERYATNHHEVLLTPDILAETLPKIARHYGQPNSAVLSNWFISREMAKDIKVAISGDGADELFGSYFLHRIAGALSEAKRRGDDVPIERLPDGERRFALANRDRSWAELADHFGVFTSEELKRLLRPSTIDGGAILAALRRREAELVSADILDRALEFDCRNLLVDQILNYSDTLSMAHSLEVRTPFLDHRLVERMFQVPAELKIRNGETKWLLKQVARRYLPEELIVRPKEGFVEPAVYWIKNELADLCKSYLLTDGFDRRGLLDGDYVRTLVNGFYTDGDFSTGKKVWNLLMFAMWERHGAS